jgi:hypothetical protein
LTLPDPEGPSAHPLWCGRETKRSEAKGRERERGKKRKREKKQEHDKDSKPFIPDLSPFPLSDLPVSQPVNSADPQWKEKGRETGKGG